MQWYSLGCWSASDSSRNCWIFLKAPIGTSGCWVRKEDLFSNIRINPRICLGWYILRINGIFPKFPTIICLGMQTSFFLSIAWVFPTWAGLMSMPPRFLPFTTWAKADFSRQSRALEPCSWVFKNQIHEITWNPGTYFLRKNIVFQKHVGGEFLNKADLACVQGISSWFPSRHESQHSEPCWSSLILGSCWAEALLGLVLSSFYLQPADLHQKKRNNKSAVTQEVPQILETLRKKRIFCSQKRHISWDFPCFGLWFFRFRPFSVSENSARPPFRPSRWPPPLGPRPPTRRGGFRQKKSKNGREIYGKLVFFKCVLLWCFVVGGCGKFWVESQVLECTFWVGKSASRFTTSIQQLNHAKPQEFSGPEWPETPNPPPK